MSMTATAALLTAADLEGVRHTVVDANPGMTEELAARIVEQGLAFVATAAAFPEANIAPSPVVDEGWHALVLNTVLYADLCDRLGGFVHHQPQRPEDGEYNPSVIERTIATMAEAGYQADLELWQGPVDNQVAVGALTWHTPPGGCGPIVLPKKPGGNSKTR